MVQSQTNEGTKFLKDFFIILRKEQFHYTQSNLERNLCEYSLSSIFINELHNSNDCPPDADGHAVDRGSGVTCLKQILNIYI